jgi:serine protease inhibitor
MVYAGSKSETADQLKQLLSLDEFENMDQLLNSINSYLTKLNTEINSKDIQLNTANKLYPRNGFNINQLYLNILKTHFHSEVQQLDYNNALQASKTINDWVLAQTKDKIKDLGSFTYFNFFVFCSFII